MRSELLKNKSTGELIMNKIQKKALKRKILQNFIKLIESKPELMDDIDLKDAYKDLKSKLVKK